MCGYLVSWHEKRLQRFHLVKTYQSERSPITIFQTMRCERLALFFSTALGDERCLTTSSASIQWHSRKSVIHSVAKSQMRFFLKYSFGHCNLVRLFLNFLRRFVRVLKATSSFNNHVPVQNGLISWFMNVGNIKPRRDHQPLRSMIVWHAGNSYYILNEKT